MVDLNQLEKIIEFSYDPITLSDKDGKYILANQAAADFFRMDLKSLVGKNCNDMYKEKIVDRYPPTMQALEQNRVVTALVKIFDQPLLCTSIPLLDENGTVSMVLTNSRAKSVLDEFTRQITFEQQEYRRYQEISDYMQSRAKSPLVYKSKAMHEIAEYCMFLGGVDSSVLVTGESGVGKDVISNYIHAQSNRRTHPFIPINCSAIPRDLFEAEFFGYQAGAFTGANAKGKIGYFQMAHKGTLFLDEVGELPLEMQAKLLRIAEGGEFYQVGGDKPIQVDIRIICATNQNIPQMIQEKRFREDLYYRLNTLSIQVPPLRDRQEDIEALAVHFSDYFSKKYSKPFFLTDEQLCGLHDYNWPGNVRELRNTIERMVLLEDTDQKVKSNVFSMGANATAPSSPAAAPLMPSGNDHTIDIKLDAGLSLKEAVEQAEKLYIAAVLAKNQNNIGTTAKTLGVHRATLYRKQKKEDPSLPDE